MSLLLHRGLRDRWQPRERWRSRVILAGWAAAAHTFVDPERCLMRQPRRNRGDPCAVHFRFCGRRACISNSRKRNRVGPERDGKTPGQAGSGQLSRIVSALPGLWPRSLVWDSLRASSPLSEWECAHSDIAQFRPRVAEVGCYFSKCQSAQYQTMLAFCFRPTHLSSQALDPVTVVAGLASILDVCRGARSPVEKVSDTPAIAPVKNAVLRGSHRRHVEVMTAVESFSLAAVFVCSPQVPWNHQCDARQKNAGGPDDSSHRALAPATASGLSLRAPWSFTKRHHDGQANPREGQKQPILSPI